MKITDITNMISSLSIRWIFKILILVTIGVCLLYSKRVKDVKMAEQELIVRADSVARNDVINNNNKALTGNFIYEKQISVYAHDMVKFKKLTIDYSNELNIPYEWLLCAIKSESNFNPLASNSKGSGALGFIQFMPFNYNSKEFDNLTKNQFINLGWEQQLYYTFRYLKNRMDSKNKAGKNVKNFTDFYMIIFYPDAVGRENTYEIARLYTNNKVVKRRYIQNSGCDMYTNGTKVAYKDGRVVSNPDKILTIRDMTVWLYNRFPEAYNLKN